MASPINTSVLPQLPSVQACPWLAKCPRKSASADLSLGGFLAMTLILAVLWLAYMALYAYIRQVCPAAMFITQH